jgi:Helicase associated domain
VLAIHATILGLWVSNQRFFYKNWVDGNIGTGVSITEERRAQLNGIGFE